MLVVIIAAALVVLIGSGALLAELVNRDDDVNDGRGEDTSEVGASDPETSATPGDLFDGDAVTDWGEVEIIEVETTASSITVATNASADVGDCLVDVVGTAPALLEQTVSCDQFTVDGLWASDTYEIRIYREHGFVDWLTATAETEAIVGEVYWNCPQTREYCQDQGGEPGIRGTPFSPADTVDTAAVGETFTLNCTYAAETITPRGEEEDGYWDYHEGKDASDLMVQVELPDGIGYIPFVWLVIDPDDVNSLGGLPEC